MLKMQQQALWVSGKIDFDNAEDYYQQGLKLIQQQSFPLLVNLSELEQGSTLALAVLVRWLRQTPQAQGLHFQGVPAKMLKIIQSCHLEHDLILI